MAGWLRERPISKNPISKKTVEGYERNIEILKRGLRGALKAEAAERLKLSRLGVAHLERAYDYLLENGKLMRNGATGPLTKQSVLHCHRLAHKTFGDAAGRLKLIPFNPASNAEHPTPKRGKNKSYKSKVRPFTRDEVLLMLELATDKVCPPDTYVMCALLIVAGLRRGELAGLADDAIDYADGKIKVFRSVVEVDGQPLLQDGALDDEDEDGAKSEAGVRDIVIPPLLVEVLRDHRKRVLEAALIYGKGYQWQPLLLFPGFEGAPQNPKLITRADGPAYHPRQDRPHQGQDQPGALVASHPWDAAVSRPEKRQAGPGAAWPCQSQITMDLYVHGLTETDEAAADFFGKLIER